MSLLGPPERLEGEDYLPEGMGVDYLARLSGNECPIGMFKQFPQLIAEQDEQAEEYGQIHLIITLDNWQWMPVRQASPPASKQDQPNP
jgi:hypothetical protein